MLKYVFWHFWKAKISILNNFKKPKFHVWSKVKLENWPNLIFEKPVIRFLNCDPLYLIYTWNPTDRKIYCQKVFIPNLHMEYLVLLSWQHCNKSHFKLFLTNFAWCAKNQLKARLPFWFKFQPSTAARWLRWHILHFCTWQKSNYDIKSLQVFYGGNIFLS